MFQAGLIGIAGLCVAGVVAVSMTMNFLFGYGFGVTPAGSVVWGGLSVAVDGLKAVLPVLIAAQWSQRHWGRVAVCAVLFPLVVAYGFLSAVGFAGQSRGVFVAGRENASASYNELKGEIDRLQLLRSGLGKARLEGEINADIATLRREVAWAASRECRAAANPAQRDVCKRWDALSAELVRAIEARRLDGELKIQKASVVAAREQGGAEPSDYRVIVLMWLFRIDSTGAALGVNWFVAALVEIISAFGLLVVDQARKAPKTEDEGIPEAMLPKPWRIVGGEAEGIKHG